jgi:hypothetical protein
MNEIYIVFVVSIILMAATIILTYKSKINRDLKVSLYVVSILTPPIAIIMFIVFYLKHKREMGQTENA